MARGQKLSPRRRHSRARGCQGPARPGHCFGHRGRTGLWAAAGRQGQLPAAQHPRSITRGQQQPREQPVPAGICSSVGLPIAARPCPTTSCGMWCPARAGPTSPTPGALCPPVLTHRLMPPAMPAQSHRAGPAGASRDALGQGPCRGCHAALWGSPSPDPLRKRIISSREGKVNAFNTAPSLRTPGNPVELSLPSNPS